MLISRLSWQMLKLVVCNLASLWGLAASSLCPSVPLSLPPSSLQNRKSIGVDAENVRGGQVGDWRERGDRVGRAHSPNVCHSRVLSSAVEVLGLGA